MKPMTSSEDSLKEAEAIVAEWVANDGNGGVVAQLEAHQKRIAETIDRLKSDLAVKDKILQDEHETALKWHRDNIALAARNVELAEALEVKDKLLVAAVEALKRISKMGDVCPEYQICSHNYCKDSYESWAEANKVLSLLRSTDKAGPSVADVVEVQTGMVLVPLKVYEAERAAQVEVVAEECHNQWAGWTTYFLGKMENAGAVFQLPQVWAERWMHQVNTPYAKLTKAEKESDRREANKILDALASARVAKEAK